MQHGGETQCESMCTSVCMCVCVCEKAPSCLFAIFQLSDHAEMWLCADWLEACWWFLCICSLPFVVLMFIYVHFIFSCSTLTVVAMENSYQAAESLWSQTEWVRQKTETEAEKEREKWSLKIKSPAGDDNLCWRWCDFPLKAPHDVKYCHMSVNQAELHIMWTPRLRLQRVFDTLEVIFLSLYVAVPKIIFQLNFTMQGHFMQFCIKLRYFLCFI